MSRAMLRSWRYCGPRGAGQGRGFSLLELMAALTLIGIVAAIALSRASSGVAAGKSAGCKANIGDIELQAELWMRNNGAWPANDLSVIGANVNYFPSGLPTCPVDGSVYTLNGSGRVSGHAH